MQRNRHGESLVPASLPADTVDTVFASHVFEHLAHDAIQSALRIIVALLEPAGVFRLIVPDLENRAWKPEHLSHLSRRAGRTKDLVISFREVGPDNEQVSVPVDDRRG